ncbi:MAG: hypothetical protein NTV63_00255 [Candidatus Woesearchaeota archaeon]|nr:hypothetical protein [Candidatus Woesearchaeota archaeon]
MQVLCLKCKGRGFCGRVYCPIYAKANSIMRMKKVLLLEGKEEFSSKAPAVLVGRSGYPNINIGIMAPPEIPSLLEHAELYDAPRTWGKNNFGVDRIIELRSALINSKFKADVKKVRSASKDNRMLELAQEVSMASKPVDVDIKIEDVPHFRINLSPDTAPFGPDARLKSAVLTQNPRINPIVEKTVSDYDFKAGDAISNLFQKGFDENFITRLLSTGTLGVKTERKLVPTRWAITAVDDSLGKERILEIKDYKSPDYLAFFGGYLGNYYLILIFPEPWAYELFETYMPQAEWNQSDEIQYMTDYEPYSGRKKYADNCAGGYYAARLPILDYLHNVKHQGSVLAIRVITGEYFCPLGVWVVREAVRKTMESKPLEFGGKELLLKYARAVLKNKFGMDADYILNSSILLKNLKSQSKLSMFS